MVFVPPLSIEKFRNGGVFATTIAPWQMPVGEEHSSRIYK
jgi:hypothetical protein